MSFGGTNVQNDFFLLPYICMSLHIIFLCLFFFFFLSVLETEEFKLIEFLDPSLLHYLEFELVITYS